MTTEQLEESLRRIFSSWKRKHKKLMTLNVGTGEGDMSLRLEDEENNVDNAETYCLAPLTPSELSLLLEIVNEHIRWNIHFKFMDAKLKSFEEIKLKLTEAKKKPCS